MTVGTKFIQDASLIGFMKDGMNQVHVNIIVYWSKKVKYFAQLTIHVPFLG
ncbi:hypothetical protein GCM10020008_09220 [Lentilactobacillus kefiri DSM 20587 = JCM 5818]|uniref:Uncharacterized protein n=1 Tax=Lentilactobacillus kefiri TaxID=33962 RepID=A0A511DYV7_LENKE|nr:hypothetical protein LKE01_22270 [Lentilactobacillus kefiri]